MEKTENKKTKRGRKRGHYDVDAIMGALQYGTIEHVAEVFNISVSQVNKIKRNPDGYR